MLSGDSKSSWSDSTAPGRGLLPSQSAGLCHSPHFPIQRLDNSCEAATGLIQILVASFQAAAERVLRAENTQGGGRRGGAGVGLGQAADHGAPQPTPILGGPGSGRQGAATRGAAGTPGRSDRTQHESAFEERHGLGATGSYCHGGIAQELFLHRPQQSWKAPTEGRGVAPYTAAGAAQAESWGRVAHVQAPPRPAACPYPRTLGIPQAAVRGGAPWRSCVLFLPVTRTLLGQPLLRLRSILSPTRLGLWFLGVCLCIAQF
jgi:hypothetical protein